MFVLIQFPLQFLDHSRQKKREWKAEAEWWERQERVYPNNLMWVYYPSSVFEIGWSKVSECEWNGKERVLNSLFCLLREMRVFALNNEKREEKE